MSDAFGVNGYYKDGMLVIDDRPSDEAAYRKFKIKNSQGDYYYLTEKNYKHFLNSPAGLGFRKNLTSTRVGNRVKISKSEYEFPSVSGEMIFYSERNEKKYDEYAEFINFTSYYPLQLFYYVPGDEKTYDEANSIYLNCIMTQATKTEISHNDGCLHVPVTFKGISFWLDGKESKLAINKDLNDPGTFTFDGTSDWVTNYSYQGVSQLPWAQKFPDIPYPYNARQDFILSGLGFPFAFGADPLRSIVLPNNGTLPTPVRISITGACINPLVRFFTEDFSEYAACGFTGNYDYVYVDANDDNESIILKQNNIVIGNPAAKQDLTLGDPDDENFYLTYMKIKPGRTLCSVSLGTDFQGTIDLTWRNEYISL